MGVVSGGFRIVRGGVGGGRHETGAEARGIDREIDLLGFFYLKDFGDGFVTFGRCLPMDGIEAVACLVFSQFLQLAAATDLSLTMSTDPASIQEVSDLATF